MKPLLAFKNFFENYNEGQIHKIDKRELVLAIGFALISFALMAFLAKGRSFYTYGAETDYMARHIIEAQRLLDGRHMTLQFHPPLYYIVLAITQSFIHNWFITGLVISWISGFIVMIVSFLFFYQLESRYAAWGCLLGLMCSPLFVTYSALASQDLFFLALYSSTFLFAIFAVRTKSKKFWILTGIFMGLTLLTRSNSITVLILFASPLLLIKNKRSFIKGSVCLFAAFFFIIGTWCIYAKIKGDPITPKIGYVGLAQNYFQTEKDPFTREARRHIEREFTSYMDVLTYNPKHMAIKYVKDFVYRLQIIFNSKMLAYPLFLLAFPGIFLLFFSSNKSFTGLFLIATIFQFALVNFSNFDFRYYFFLVPILTAGMGLCVRLVWRSLPIPVFRTLAILLFIPFVIVGLKNSYESAYRSMHAQDYELKGAVSKARILIDKNSAIVCRKPQLPFYVGAKHLKFPEVRNLKDLRTWIEMKKLREPIYLYFGPDERHFRPNLRALEFPENSIDWLKPIAQSKGPHGWILYRFMG